MKQFDSIWKNENESAKRHWNDEKATENFSQRTWAIEGMQKFWNSLKPFRFALRHVKHFLWNFERVLKPTIFICIELPIKFFLKHAKKIIKNYKNVKNIQMKSRRVQRINFSPIDEVWRELVRDIERPVELPERTLEACSWARILRLAGWFQLLRRRRARERGKRARRDSFRLTPSGVSGMSGNWRVLSEKL